MRLSPKQVELLTDIVTHPAMYITYYGPWERTAQSFVRLGIGTVRWCEGNQYELTVTDIGRAEATRRGLVPEPPKTMPTVDGIRGHRTTTPADDEALRAAALDIAPITQEQARTLGLA